MKTQMQNYKALFVLEILGRPAENVTRALQMLVEQLGKEEKVEIVTSKIFEPKAVENAKNLFSSFAEVQISVPSLEHLMGLCFRYMPSSIEVEEPSEINMNLNELNVILNGLIARLHDYDSVAKRLALENNILANQLKAAGMTPGMHPSMEKTAGKTDAGAGKKVAQSGKKKAQGKKKK